MLDNGGEMISVANLFGPQKLLGLWGDGVHFGHSCHSTSFNVLIHGQGHGPRIILFDVTTEETTFKPIPESSIC